ncbi:hypothetical protein [Rhizosaccharibacter radicis]|uniref:Transcriptional regulator n=1 Tax=Rhizosaccharibacter radicis TaxID=2782605 RepID=A0ABT1W301_9PROT|nr:hypothetical protein [Acetobacteraceae bacterium KSS12]
MPEFTPVETVADFHTLDEADLLEGYLDGFHGSPAPGSDRSRGYWHGWREGRVAAGLAEAGPDQLRLARAFDDLDEAGNGSPPDPAPADGRGGAPE